MKRMKQRAKPPKLIYLTLIVLGIVCLAGAYSMRTTLAGALPVFEPDPVRQAWQLAKRSGRYEYYADARQTLHPTARIENAGRSPRTQRITASGLLDLNNEIMEMRIWSQADNRTVEMRLADGKTYGRLDENAPWEEVDNTSEVFAPGGDPLGFLSAAENIQEVHTNPDTDESGYLPFELDPNAYSRYTFDINGPQYAQFMRRQMQEQMQRNGELPPGMTLGQAEELAEITARGELWIDDQGLPVRQIVHMEFPPESDAFHWREIEVTTDFSDWSPPPTLSVAAFWQDPALIAENPAAVLGISDAKLQQVGSDLGFLLVFLIMLLMLWTHRHSRKLQSTLALTIIVAMVVSPLLQAERVYAFDVDFDVKVAEAEAQREAQESVLSFENAEKTFNPSLNPLAESASTATLPAYSVTSASGPSKVAQSTSAQETCDLNDSSGDCDEDGLSNGVELLELGTDPEYFDSDGDGISDGTEVAGFTLNGKQWYLDPLHPDSNRDGQIDSLECPELQDVNADGELTTPSGAICTNSDDDDTPDVFDFDNDGDGVPDTVDANPYYSGELTSETHSELNLSFSNYVSEKPILVDIQLRPTDPDHLWHTNNVFDWPDNDKQGQIQRVFDTTLIDFSSSEDPDPSLADGDMMATPMLEVTIPAPSTNSNPSGGLPVLDSVVEGYDFADNSIDDWLDREALRSHGIEAKQSDAGEPIYLYVPLTVVEDDTGDTPVAWGARLLYQPIMDNWGSEHEVQLIWNVTGVLDSCDTDSQPDSVSYDEWCADESNWKSETTALHVYREDFRVTSLTVMEEHGTKTAAIAQDNAVDTDVAYADRLWYLAYRLQQTFVPGNLYTDTVDGTNKRFDIDEIVNRFDATSGVYSTGASQLWGIDPGELSVVSNSAADQTSAMDALITTQIPALLAETYQDGSSKPVTLLFAREEARRAVSLGDADAVAITNASSVAVDFAEAESAIYTSLHWGAFEYDGSEWLSYDLYDFLQHLETELADVLTTTVLAELSDGDLSDGEDLLRLGATNLAKNFYLVVNRGLSSIVEVQFADGTSTIFGDDVIVEADLALSGQSPVQLVIGDTLELISAVAAFDSTVTLEPEGEAIVSTYVANLTQKATILSTVGAMEASFDDSVETQLSSGVAGKGINRLAQRHLPRVMGADVNLDGDYSDAAWDVGALLSFAALGIELAGAELGWSEEGTFALATMLKFGGAAFDVLALKNYLELYRTATAAEGASALSATARSLTNANAVCAMIGFFITGVIAVGLFVYTMISQDLKWGSLQANALVAQTIGTLVVAYIMLVISVLFPIGTIIVAIIGLIDLIISTVCSIVEYSGEEIDEDVNEWVCGGISGAVANGITYLIYDQYITVDLDRDDRLEVTLGTPVLGNGGFSHGTPISFTMDLTNTISLAEPDRVIVRTSYLDGNGNLDRDRLRDIMRRSSFDYSLQTYERSDDENTLGLDETEWTNDQASFALATTPSLSEPGINHSLDLVLTEFLNVALIECWGFIGADENATCDEEEFKQTVNTELSEFVFDIFPATFAEFVSLQPAGSGNQRLAWGGSPQFPVQVDADGDGLRSQALGGPDPNDADADSDDDGLSDFYEVANGTNPLSVDTDDDGLSDYWEVYYYTNPRRADSDSDGLWDSDEFFHSGAANPFVADNSTWAGGWLITYDFDTSSQPMQTIVSADPLLYDSDFDTILDNAEFIYGYNPNLSSEMNVLSFDSGIQTDAAVPNVVQLGGTFEYTATIQNELDNRIMDGLLEVEYPIDTPTQIQTVFSPLYPLRSANLGGQVAAGSVGTDNLAIRAGIVADTSTVDQAYSLRFDEAAGSTTFLDATLAQNDFTCSGSACPTANGGSATFAADDLILIEHRDAFNQDAFSLEIWVIPQGTNGRIYNDTNDFSVSLNYNNSPDPWVDVSLDGTQQLAGSLGLALDKLNQILITFDGAALNLYVNGKLDKSATGLTPIVRDDGSVEIGGGTAFEIDEATLYNYALTGDDVAEMFGSLAFYVDFNDDNALTLDPVSPEAPSSRLLCFRYGEETTRKSNMVNCEITYYDGLSYGGPEHVVGGGISGSAMKLTAFDEKVNLPDKATDSLNQTLPLAKDDNAFSVSLWVKADLNWRENGNRGLLEIESEEGGKLELWTFTEYEEEEVVGPIRAILDSRALVAELGTCQGSGDYREPPGNRIDVNDFLEDQEWLHMVVTYDGSGTLGFYKNGALVHSQSGCGAVDFQRLSGFTIGGSDSTENAFAGLVDEWRLYGKVLSSDEINKIYRSSSRTLDMQFDEPPGQSAFVDDSSFGYTGVCSGTSCPDSGLPGLDNQALRFDGTDDFVSLTDAEGLGLAESSFTVMGWVKSDTASSGNMAILGNDATADAQSLWLGMAGGKPVMHFGGSANSLTGSTTLTNGEWTYLAYRYTYQNDEDPDNPVYVGEQAIFINGVQDATGTSDSAFLDPSAASLLNIGRAQSGQYFNGLLDHLVIVQEALTAAEIQAVMQEAPVFNLHLDEDLNTTSFINEGPFDGDATCSGDACPTAGAAGWMREAPVFDGNDRLTIPALTNFTNDVGMALWVKPTKTTGGEQYLLGDPALTPDKEFKLWIEENGTSLALTVGELSGSVCFANDSPLSGSLLEDRWNHVMVTVDVGDTLTTVRLYINGGQTATANYQSLCGTDLTVVGDGFVGQIDELAIYNTYLSVADVKELYDYQASWFDVVMHHQITVDGDNPVLSLDLPTYVMSKTTTLNVSAVDATAISDVAVTIMPPTGNAYTEAATANSTDGNGSWSYNFTPSGAGAYEITVVATDAVGYTATESHTLYVDDTAPSATLDSSLTSGPIAPEADGDHRLFGTLDDSGTVASGADGESVTVEVIDWQGATVGGSQPATADSESWQVDYPLSLPQYGEYDVEVTVGDVAGNSSTSSVGTILLDGLGPYADLSVGGGIISATDSVLTGAVSDVPLPPHSDLVQMHFEEASGATSYIDGSGHQFTATCDSGSASCPTAGISGYYGAALQFDGNDDVTIAAQDALTLTTGTLMAWVQPNLSADATLLAMDDGSTTGFRWQIQGDGQALLVNNGSTVASLPVSLTNGQWSHLALTIEDETWTAYVNGVAAGTVTQTVTIPADLPLHIGSANGSSDHFSGLIDEVAIYNNRLTADEIYDIANPLATTVSDVEIQLRHMNGGVWPDVEADGLKLYLPLDDSEGTSAFDYHSYLDYTITCDDGAETCPTSSIYGQYDGSFDFDGNDYITISDEANFDFQEMTVAFWLKAYDASQFNEPLVTKGSDSWQITTSALNNQRTVAFTTPGVTTDITGGSATMISTQVIEDNSWYHVAVVYDGSTKSIYVNGTLKGTEAVVGTLTTNDAAVLLGANADLVGSGSDLRFNGALDEVAFFDRALSQTEIQSLRASAPWQEVTLDTPGSIYSTWQTALPSDMEGLYAISLRATDSVGNVRTMPNIWQGTIDLNPPRASFIYEPVGNGDVQVYCQAADFFLDESSWVCPATSLSATTADNDWLLETFSSLTVTETLESDQEIVPISEVTSMAACDIAGNCTTLTETTLSDISVIVTPTTGTMLTSYDPITISGFANSARPLLFVELQVNGETVYSESWQDGDATYSENWTTTWTPPTGSPTFSLVAYVAVEGYETGQGLHNNENVIESTEVLLSAPVLSIAKTVAPNQLISQGDAVTYTVVVANNTEATDLAGVVIIDTLPAGVDGTDLSATVDLAAGERVTYTIPAVVTAASFESVENTATATYDTSSFSDSVSFFSCVESIEVQNANPNGDGSLAQAISDLCDGGMITFASDLSIAHEAAQTGLIINKSMTIDGSGYNVSITGAQSNSPVLTINSGGTVMLQGIEIQGTDGGTAAVEIGSSDVVTMTDVTLRDAAVVGSAVVNNLGDLTLIDSTGIGTNSQVMLGSGSYGEGTLTVINSTLSGAGLGTGIRNRNVANVYQSTIVGFNAGILNIFESSFLGTHNGVITTTNSIVINSGGDCTDDGTFNDGGYNLFGAGGGCPVDSGTSQTADPATLFTSVVGPLADNGGDTQTHALLGNSPALDAIPNGTNGCGTDITTDQRGVARPQFDACDIGAYEYDGTVVNVAPVLDEIPAQSVAISETLTFTATASDANGDPLTFSLGDAPVAATIDGSSGLFTWTPDTLGIYTATVIVSDGVLTDSQEVGITVIELNVAPVLDEIPTQSVVISETLTFTATASDANGNTLSFSLGDAPVAATIDGSSGLFTWTPDALGIYTATVIVSDGVLTDSQEVAITVTEQMPLLYLPLDEAAGATTFADQSGNGLDATCDNAAGQCPQSILSSVQGTAPLFDGTNDYLDVPFVLNPAATSFTAAAWFNVTSHTGTEYILQQLDASGPGRSWLYVLTNGRIGTFLGGTGLNGSTLVTTGQWHHIAVTYDQESGILNLYLDGQVERSVSKVMESTLGAMRIGAHKSSANWFDGAIDEVVMYDSALTAADIAALATPPVQAEADAYSADAVSVLDVAAPGILENDVDANGHALTATLVSTPTNGTVILNADGSFSYTPTPFYEGSDSFTYQASNGTDLTKVTEVVLDVALTSQVLYLPLDEAEGAASFSDLSGNGNSATCDDSAGQCPAAGKPGPFATSVRFDEVDDYVSIPNAINPSVDEFTLALWFRMPDFGTLNRVLLNQRDGAGVGRTWLGIQPSGRFFSFLGGATTFASQTTIEPSQWYHGAVTYDGATVRLYLDGVQVGEAQRDAESSDGSLVLGAHKTLNQSLYKGTVDEVMIFDRVVTDATLAVLATFEDNDGDGIADSLELGAANNGDGNSDGVADIDQQNVSSLPAAGNGEGDYITLAAPADSTLTMVTVSAVPQSEDGTSPAGVEFPIGYVNFNVQNVVVGGALTVDIFPPDLSAFITYYKYGSPAAGEPEQWYEFLYDGSTGAEFLSDRIRLHFVDGGRGDADLTANGVIVDPGIPSTINVAVIRQIVNEPVDVSIPFVRFDPEVQTATWTWDDGTTTPATFDAASGRFVDSHTYSAAGSYQVVLAVTGNENARLRFSRALDVTIYDPAAGKTAGGGKIDSPAGAYKLDPSISGLVDFNLPVDYKPNATEPQGNFRFNFKDADMDFAAEEYGWLVVRPDGTAIARGRGTINGQMDANGNLYHFQFWATDGSPDTLRVRIWSRDARPFVWWLNTGGTVIYDNGSELPINNGNVQVIVGRSNGSSQAAQTDAENIDQSLAHQLYLPLVANHSDLAQRAKEPGDGPKNAEPASSPVDANTDVSEDGQSEATDTTDAAEDVRVIQAHRIFLPVVQNLE